MDNILPPDLVTYIYHITHTLYMSDIMDEIQEINEKKRFDAEALIAYLSHDDQIQDIDPLNIFYILVAMKNDDLLSYREFVLRLIHIKQDIEFRLPNFHMTTDEVNSLISDDSISISDIMFTFYLCLPDARRLIDDIDHWIAENVN